MSIISVLPLGIATPLWAQDEGSSQYKTNDALGEARQIIAIMYPPDERDQMFAEMVDALGSQFADSLMTDPVFDEPGIRKIMVDFIDGLSDRMMPSIKKHMPSILEATAVAYTNKFSLEELKDIREFAETESGGRYLKESLSLLSDPAVAAANQAYFAEIQTEREEAAAELRQKAIDYLIENPEALERIAGKYEGAN